MTHTYYATGMTCEGCSSKIKKALLSIPQILSVHIDLNNKKVIVEMNQHVDSKVLNQTLSEAGKYSLSEQLFEPTQKSGVAKFIPLIIIFAFIIILTIGRQWFRGNIEPAQAMADFMGFFFVIFGGFKIINWKGFVESYSSYDLLARKSKAYAYAYPLIELGLGIAYLFRFQLMAVSWLTLVLMVVSSIGVAQALMSKKQIVCACLGAVFKIPMTKVTLMEDVLMALMAALMIANF